MNVSLRRGDGTAAQDVAPGVSRGRAERRSSTVGAVLGVVLLARLLTVEVGGLAYVYLPHAWVEAPPGTLPPSGGLIYRVLVGLWAHWDGLWYLSIADHGYAGRATATAFFPLYPLAIHLLGGTVEAALAVSLVACAVSYWLLYRLAAEILGEEPAWYTILGLAAFPTAFYLTAAYSESLFMALSLGCLHLMRHRRYWLAGVLGALATLVTTYGVLLAPALAWRIWKAEGWEWRRWLTVAVIPLGLLAYALYLVPLFGDPLVFEHAQSNWGRHFGLPTTTAWLALQAAWQGLGQLAPSALFAPGEPTLGASNVFDLLFAAFAWLLWLAGALPRRLPGELVIYALLALLVPAVYPAAGTPLMSMPRLVLEAFPIFLVLGQWLAAGRARRWAYFAAAIPLSVLFIALFATAHWVA